MARTFKGGIHPGDFKQRTASLPLVEAPLPATVTIHLLQHIGALCTPMVKRGDLVQTGQPVGAPQGFVSAPVHASVTGKVTKLDEAPHPVTGKPSMAVTIERTGEDEWFEGANTPRDTGGLDAKALRDIIRDAGIVGMGGATFPTHVKLSPPPGTTIDAVIVNGAECEPFLTCDDRMMIERADDVVAGLRLLLRVLGDSQGYVGIEANKPAAFAAMRAAAGNDGKVIVEQVEVKYPQGAEQQLIKALLGREVPWHGGLPMHVGCVVQNVSTCVAVAEAVQRNIPLIRRALTITGDAVEKPANLVARIGTSVSSLLADAGVAPDAAKLILGGPMMGIAQWTDDIATLKGTSGLLLLRDAAKAVSRSCIRCGRCVRACPLRLAPAEFSRAIEKDIFDLAFEYDVMECKECGCCAYVCPSKRPIVHQVKLAKAEFARRRAEQQAKQRAQEAKAKEQEAKTAAAKV